MQTRQHCIWKLQCGIYQLFCAWQCHKVPFHLCALHNPNPLQFVFSESQTPQLSVEYLAVCLDDNFQKSLFLLKNINAHRGMCMHIMSALAECESELKPSGWHHICYIHAFLQSICSVPTLSRNFISIQLNCSSRYLTLLRNIIAG